MLQSQGGPKAAGPLTPQFPTVQVPDFTSFDPHVLAGDSFCFIVKSKNCGHIHNTRTWPPSGPRFGRLRSVWSCVSRRSSCGQTGSVPAEGELGPRPPARGLAALLLPSVTLQAPSAGGARCHPWGSARPSTVGLGDVPLLVCTRRR